MIFWQETCFVVLAGTKLLMKQQYLDFPAAMNFQKNLLAWRGMISKVINPSLMQYLFFKAGISCLDVGKNQ